MLKLLNNKAVPVGGFRYVDPDTDFVFEKGYNTFADLEAHVAGHREQNKLPPIEDFRSVWENWICQEFGMEGKCCPVTADVKRTFEQYVKGGKALVKQKIKQEFVDPKLAEFRASICNGCNQNVSNVGHRMSQFYTDKYMLHQIGNRVTSFDETLYTCKVCTCLLRSKVHYPDDIVSESLTDTDVGRLNREPKDIRTGQKLRCWQLDCVDKEDG